MGNTAMMELRLRPYHDARGAVFRSDAGWEVPTGYGPLDAEVRAVRTRAGVIDRSDRAKVRVTGADRVTFLDGLVTSDMKTLVEGTSAYALLLNEKSRVLGDLRVYAFSDAFVMDIDAGQKDAVLRHLEKHLVSDDVAFEDLGSCGHIEVHGPASGDLVAAGLGADIRGLALDAFRTLPIDKKHEAHAARVRGTGEAGFAIWSAGTSLADVWERLERRGAAPIGRDAWEVLRIEAGIPRVGAEMTQDTLALEVAPAHAISYTKGCYVGQEVVARGTYVGHMNRKLSGLRIDGDLPPSPGDKVRTGGRDFGVVTSATWSPTLGWAIALALMRLDALSAGSPLFVDRGGWDLRASVHPLPFVRGRT